MTAVEKHRIAVARMVEFPGEAFWDPERCRDDVPTPLPVPWEYVPPVLTQGRSSQEEFCFLCVHCHYFFFVGLKEAQSNWPLCDVCGISFNLVATGNLPFASATDEDRPCLFCGQFGLTLDKLGCGPCNFLLKKAIEGDRFCKQLLLAPPTYQLPTAEERNTHQRHRQYRKDLEKEELEIVVVPL